MTRKFPMYILLLAIVVNPMAIDIYLPSMPDMADSFQVSMSQIQLTLTLFLAALGVGQLFAGPLADRYGRRPLLVLGMLGYATGALTGAWVEQIELLWAARILQGLGTCAVTVGVMSGVRDSVSGEKSATMYSYLNGVISTVPALAPMLGGWISSVWGWRATFVFMGLYALCMFLLALIRLPESRPADTISSGSLINPRQYKPVLADGQFRFNGGLVMLAMAIIITFVSLAPVRLMVELGVSSTEFALWFGSNAAVNVLVAFVAPIAIKRVGKSAVLKSALMMCAISALTLVAFQDIAHPAAFMLPAYLASTAFSLILAICTGLALEPFSKRAGTAASLLGFFQMAVGSALSGLLIMLPFEASQIMAITVVLPLIWYLIPVIARPFVASSQEMA